MKAAKFLSVIAMTTLLIFTSLQVSGQTCPTMLINGCYCRATNGDFSTVRPFAAGCQNTGNDATFMYNDRRTIEVMTWDSSNDTSIIHWRDDFTGGGSGNFIVQGAPPRGDYFDPDIIIYDRGDPSTTNALIRVAIIYQDNSTAGNGQIFFQVYDYDKTNGGLITTPVVAARQLSTNGTCSNPNLDVARHDSLVDPPGINTNRNHGTVVFTWEENDSIWTNGINIRTGTPGTLKYPSPALVFGSDSADASHPDVTANTNDSLGLGGRVPQASFVFNVHYNFVGQRQILVHQYPVDDLDPTSASMALSAPTVYTLYSPVKRDSETIGPPRIASDPPALVFHATDFEVVVKRDPGTGPLIEAWNKYLNKALLGPTILSACPTAALTACKHDRPAVAYAVDYILTPWTIDEDIGCTATAPMNLKDVLTRRIYASGTQAGTLVDAILSLVPITLTSNQSVVSVARHHPVGRISNDSCLLHMV